MKRLGRACAFAAVLAVTFRARGGSPLDDCVASYDATQRLKSEGKLREAETKAIACAQDVCPAELRKDCLRWVEEVNRDTPSLVVHAVGPDACDLEQARVVVDGAVVAEKLEGKPVALDPGVHTVRVATPGSPPIEQRVVLSPGEKNRVVEVRFAPAGATCRAPKVESPRPMPPPPLPPQPARGRPVPPLVYVLGGASLLSLGVASGFYISANSQKGTLDDCRPKCATGDVDTMRRTYLIGDVLLAVGVTALATAAILYVTRPEVALAP